MSTEEKHSIIESLQRNGRECKHNIGEVLPERRDLLIMSLLLVAPTGDR
jgi:hypothetical protein